MTERLLATLKLTYSDGNSGELELFDGSSIKIGRDANCQLSLPEAGVSRVHATIDGSSTGVMIADNASLNGTYVNGEKISTIRVLSSKDIIDIGGTKISVTVHDLDAIKRGSEPSGSRAMTAQLKPVSVAILVVGVKRYTDLLEELQAPAKVVEMLMQWNSAISKHIEARGGIVDRVIDSNLISFWVGEDEDELARTALEVTIELQNITSNLIQSEWEFHDENPWQTFFVLNSGQGLQGAVGTGEASKDFTMLGDPINELFALSERTRGADPDVLISSTAAAHVEHFASLKPISADPEDGFTLSAG